MIRRVATPEGSKFYDLPIGAVIPPMWHKAKIKVKGLPPTNASKVKDTSVNLGTTTSDLAAVKLQKAKIGSVVSYPSGSVKIQYQKIDADAWIPAGAFAQNIADKGADPTKPVTSAQVVQLSGTAKLDVQKFLTVGDLDVAPVGSKLAAVLGASPATYNKLADAHPMPGGTWQLDGGDDGDVVSGQELVNEWEEQFSTQYGPSGGLTGSLILPEPTPFGSGKLPTTGGGVADQPLFSPWQSESAPPSGTLWEDPDSPGAFLPYKESDGDVPVYIPGQQKWGAGQVYTDRALFLFPAGTEVEIDGKSYEVNAHAVPGGLIPEGETKPVPKSLFKGKQVTVTFVPSGPLVNLSTVGTPKNGQVYVTSTGTPIIWWQGAYRYALSGDIANPPAVVMQGPVLKAKKPFWGHEGPKPPYPDQHPQALMPQTDLKVIPGAHLVTLPDLPVDSLVTRQADDTVWRKSGENEWSFVCGKSAADGTQSVLSEATFAASSAEEFSGFLIHDTTLNGAFGDLAHKGGTDHFYMADSSAWATPGFYDSWAVTDGGVLLKRGNWSAGDEWGSWRTVDGALIFPKGPLLALSEKPEVPQEAGPPPKAELSEKAVSAKQLVTLPIGSVVQIVPGDHNVSVGMYTKKSPSEFVQETGPGKSLTVTLADVSLNVAADNGFVVRHGMDWKVALGNVFTTADPAPEGSVLVDFSDAGNPKQFVVKGGVWTVGGQEYDGPPMAGMLSFVPGVSPTGKPAPELQYGKQVSLEDLPVHAIVEVDGKRVVRTTNGTALTDTPAELPWGPLAKKFKTGKLVFVPTSETEYSGEQLSQPYAEGLPAGTTIHDAEVPSAPELTLNDALSGPFWTEDGSGVSLEPTHRYVISYLPYPKTISEAAVGDLVSEAEFSDFHPPVGTVLVSKNHMAVATVGGWMYDGKFASLPYLSVDEQWSVVHVGDVDKTFSATVSAPQEDLSQGWKHYDADTLADLTNDGIYYLWQNGMVLRKSKGSTVWMGSSGSVNADLPQKALLIKAGDPIVATEPMLKAIPSGSSLVMGGEKYTKGSNGEFHDSYQPILTNHLVHGYADVLPIVGENFSLSLWPEGTVVKLYTEAGSVENPTQKDPKVGTYAVHGGHLVGVGNGQTLGQSELAGTLVVVQSVPEEAEWEPPDVPAGNWYHTGDLNVALDSIIAMGQPYGLTGQVKFEGLLPNGEPFSGTYDWAANHQVLSTQGGATATVNAYASDIAVTSYGKALLTDLPDGSLVEVGVNGVKVSAVIHQHNDNNGGQGVTVKTVDGDYVVWPSNALAELIALPVADSPIPAKEHQIGDGYTDKAGVWHPPIKATQEQVQQAIATLTSAKGIMVKQPLQKIGNPLWDCDYKKVALDFNATLPADQQLTKVGTPDFTKQLFIGYLSSLLDKPVVLSKLDAVPPLSHAKAADVPPVGTLLGDPPEYDDVPLDGYVGSPKEGFLAKKGLSETGTDSWHYTGLSTGDKPSVLGTTVYLGDLKLTQDHAVSFTELQDVWKFMPEGTVFWLKADGQTYGHFYQKVLPFSAKSLESGKAVPAADLFGGGHGFGVGSVVPDTVPSPPADSAVLSVGDVVVSVEQLKHLPSDSIVKITSTGATYAKDPANGKWSVVGGSGGGLYPSDTFQVPIGTSSVVVVSVGPPTPESAPLVETGSKWTVAPAGDLLPPAVPYGVVTVLSGQASLGSGFAIGSVKDANNAVKDLLEADGAGKVAGKNLTSMVAPPKYSWGHVGNQEKIAARAEYYRHWYNGDFKWCYEAEVAAGKKKDIDWQHPQAKKHPGSPLSSVKLAKHRSPYANPAAVPAGLMKATDGSKPAFMGDMPSPSVKQPQDAVDDAQSYLAAAGYKDLTGLSLAQQIRMARSHYGGDQFQTDRWFAIHLKNVADGLYQSDAVIPPSALLEKSALADAMVSDGRIDAGNYEVAHLAEPHDVVAYFQGILPASAAAYLASKNMDAANYLVMLHFVASTKPQDSFLNPAQSAILFEDLAAQLKAASAASQDLATVFSPPEVYKKDAYQPDLGGTGEKYVYSDGFGRKFVFKVGKEKFRPEVEDAAYHMTAAFGMPMPASKVMTLDGQYGQLQGWVGTYGEKQKRAFGTPPSKLTPKQLKDLFAHHVVDWVLDNDDSHGKNLLFTDDGRVVAVDKGRAWKHPNQTFRLTFDGPLSDNASVYYGDIYSAIQKHEIPQEQVDAAYIAGLREAQRIAAFPDDKFRSLLLQAMAHRPKSTFGSFGTKEALVDYYVGRKDSVVDDFTSFWGELYERTGWTTPELPKEVAPGVVSGYDPSDWTDVVATKALGKPFFFASKDVEDGHIVVSQIQGPKGPVGRARFHLRGSGLKALQAFCKAHASGELTYAAPAPSPLQSDVYGESYSEQSLWAGIVEGIKTISHHTADGEYNQSRVDQLKGSQTKIQSVLKDVDTMGQKEWQEKYFPNKPKKAGQYLEMLHQYDTTCTAVLENMASQTKPTQHPQYTYKPVVEVDVVPVAPVEEPKYSVTNVPVKYIVGKIDGDSQELVASGTEKALPGSSQQAAVEFADGVTLRFIDGTHGDLSRTGQVDIVVSNPDLVTDGQGIQEVVDFLSNIGVDMTPATSSSLELMYWRMVAGSICSRSSSGYKNSHQAQVLSEAKSHGMGWTTEGYSGHFDTLPEESEELDAWRGIFAKVYGEDAVKRVTDGLYLPKFDREPGVGRPHWQRFDVTDEMVAKQPPVAHDVMAFGGRSPQEEDARVMRVLKSGGLLATEERVRVLGEYFKGDGSSGDIGSGSSNFVFLRQHRGPTSVNQIFIDPDVLRHVSTYSADHDTFGGLEYRKDSAWDWDQLTAPTSGGNEAMVKYDVPSLSDFLFVAFRFAKNRDAMIKWYHDRGVTEINGIPVEEFLVLDSQREKAYAAAKKRLKERYVNGQSVGS